MYNPVVNNSVLIADVRKLGIPHKSVSHYLHFCITHSGSFLMQNQQISFGQLARNYSRYPSNLKPYTFAIKCDLLGLNELFFVECRVSFVGAPWMVHKWLFPGGVLEIQKVV